MCGLGGWGNRVGKSEETIYKKERNGEETRESENVSKKTNARSREKKKGLGAAHLQETKKKKGKRLGGHNDQKTGPSVSTGRTGEEMGQKNIRKTAKGKVMP